MKPSLLILTVCTLTFVASAHAQDQNSDKKKQGKHEQAVGNQPQPVTKTNAGRSNNPRKGHQNAQFQNNANPNIQGNTTGQGSGRHQGKRNGNGNGGNANANMNGANTANDSFGNKGHKGKGNDANKLNQAGNLNSGNKHLSKEERRNSPEFQAKKQKFQALHQQHLNFKAQPNQSIASVKFNKNYKIQGAQNWHGQQYIVFRNYHPQWHDQGWWHSHYNDHLLLVGGGWYFWNSGYWYPAWGYNQSESYYPYDGPIYVGRNPQPPDQTIADVQASLQEQGFYKGEVDGLLGPLTRAALAEYQQSEGLETTAAMDEPTLESLGMS